MISDFRVMGDQRELLGPVASVPTAWRAPRGCEGFVHQPLAVDQPLVRVSHVRDTTGLERHATATTPTCPAAFVPRDRAADPADAPASTPDSTAHVEPEHAPSAPRPLPVRGKPSGYTDRPTATKPVRCMSVGTLQHRGLQHDKVTHDGNSQLADRSRRWWQVLGSVQRRWSRRSDRSSLGGQLDAADLRRFRSTGLGRAIQGWLAASLRPRCPQPTRWLLRPREPFRFPAGPPVARPPGSRCAGRSRAPHAGTRRRRPACPAGGGTSRRPQGPVLPRAASRSPGPVGAPPHGGPDRYGIARRQSQLPHAVADLRFAYSVTQLTGQSESP